jgi:hypothetical protein
LPVIAEHAMASIGEARTGRNAAKREQAGMRPAISAASSIGVTGHPHRANPPMAREERYNRIANCPIAKRILDRRTEYTRNRGQTPLEISGGEIAYDTGESPIFGLLADDSALLPSRSICSLHQTLSDTH